jgi:hypothetical protein
MKLCSLEIPEVAASNPRMKESRLHKEFLTKVEKGSPEQHTGLTFFLFFFLKYSDQVARILLINYYSYGKP